MTPKWEVSSWTIRNKLKRAPANTAWEKGNNDTATTVVQSVDDEDTSSSSDESDVDEIVDDVEPHVLRDRNAWGRNYTGMGIYVSMLSC